MNMLWIIIFSCFATGDGQIDFNSHPKKINIIVSNIENGNLANSLASMESRGRRNNRLLYHMEKGRVFQIRGEFKKSIVEFKQAIKIIKRNESSSILSLKKMGKEATALFYNDKAVDYRGLGYERIFIHHYQSINYLATGDLEGALVEIRRANSRQKEELDKHDKLLEKLKQKEQKNLEKEKLKTEKQKGEASGEPQGSGRKKWNRLKKSVKNLKKSHRRASPANATDWSAVRRSMEGAFDEEYRHIELRAGKIKNSFQNAYTFFFSGLIYERSKSWDDAYIDYKKGFEIYPENESLSRNAFRLARTLKRHDDLDWLEEVYGSSPKPLQGSGESRVIVFFEEGLAPQKEQAKVSFAVSGKLISLAAPIYRLKRKPAEPLHIQSENGSARTDLLCDLHGVALRALREQARVRIARQIFRMIAKGALTEVAEDELGPLGGLAANAYGDITEIADLRSWLTLPSNIQVADLYTNQGQQMIRLRHRALGIHEAISIHPKKGQMVFLQVVHLNGKNFVNVIYL